MGRTSKRAKRGNARQQQGTGNRGDSNPAAEQLDGVRTRSGRGMKERKSRDDETDHEELTQKMGVECADGKSLHRSNDESLFENGDIIESKVPLEGYSESVDNNSLGDHMEETKRKCKKRRRSIEGPKGRGPASDRTCKHCGKVIVSMHGLKYHIDNYVCRKDAMPEPAKTAATGLKKRKSPILGRPKAKDSKRFRGSREDRTCPTCKKEFTSVHGKNYHVKNAVCTEQASHNLAGTLAFPILPKGSRYITKYGVVEVIADDRETPTYVFPDDIKVEQKKYTNYKDKQFVQRRKIYLDFGFQSRLRRRRLRRMYESKNVHSVTVGNAYFGGSASGHTTGKTIAIKSSCKQDPMLHPGGFPDRIVVCRPIPCERQRLFSLDQDASQDKVLLSTIEPSAHAILYLRRRELNKVYSQSATVYTCMDCGTDYTSREGFAYHLQTAVCSKKAAAKAAQRDEMNQSIQLRVDRHLQRNAVNSAHKKRKGEMAIYPQVWNSLAFQSPIVVKAPKQMEKGDAINFEKRIKEIDTTLKFFRAEVRKETAKRHDQKHGAIYGSVFKSLGFRKPQPPKRERTKQTISKKSGGRSKPSSSNKADDHGNRGVEHDGDAEKSPEVPIVDIQVLIDEAKSGRYPSMQRYEGKYPDDCAICKDGGDLFLCDFCSNAVHYECILAKIIVKKPEPEEDFMCHCCAKKIVTRRNRAEKRRLLKQEAVLGKARQKVDDRETVEGHTEPKNENEYHSAATVGKELSELIELLGDARKTLHQMVEASKINRFRRIQLGISYPG